MAGLAPAYVRGPKYTPARRQQALDHSATLGRRRADTFKSLGYPSRPLLASWIRAAHPEHRPRVGQAHEALSSQAKQSAVIALWVRQGSVQQVTQEQGVSRPLPYNGRDQLLGNGALASMQPLQGPPPSPRREELERKVDGG